MSTLATTNIKHPSSASNNIVLDSSGGVDLDALTVSGSAPADSVNIDASGRLLVGTTTSTAAASLVCQGTSASSTAGTQIWLQRGQAAASIGTDETLGRINFADNAGNAYAFIEGGTNGSGGSGDYPGKLVFSTTADGASSPTERMRITNAGVLQVGSASNNTLLSGTQGYLLSIGQSTNNGPPEVNGCIQVRNGGNGNDCGFISNTVYNNHFKFYWRETLAGSITSPNAASVAYNTSSDYRLKENIVPLTDAIKRINQLQVHRFNFICDFGRTVDGFIAHEVQAVVPECVTGTKDEVDADGNPVYQGIDQSKLVPLLTAALQETITELQALKAEVAALKAS